MKDFSVTITLFPKIAILPSHWQCLLISCSSEN